MSHLVFIYNLSVVIVADESCKCLPTKQACTVNIPSQKHLFNLIGCLLLINVFTGGYTRIVGTNALVKTEVVVRISLRLQNGSTLKSDRHLEMQRSARFLK